MFTPALIGTDTNPSVTYSNRVGRYQRVGRIVHVEIRIQVATRSGGSGALRVAGLPFTAAGGDNTAPLNVIPNNVSLPTGRSTLAAHLVAGGTTIALAGAGDGGSLANLTPANISAGSLLLIGGAYLTD